MPWLSRPHTLQLIFSLRSMPGDSKVAALLKGKEWDADQITSEFHPLDTECILSMPLPTGDNRDTIIWHYEKIGKFSVRSAYNLACGLLERASSGHSGHGSSFIWRTKLPPKVQLFAWWSSTNALPTINNLQRRRMEAVSDLPWSTIESRTTSPEDWFRSVSPDLDSSEYAMFLLLFWSLWFCRNRKAFKGGPVHAHEVVGMAQRQWWTITERPPDEPG
ncbi:hypothetical protein Salat_0610200 [Sesamum alatum]|uniref:Reverse transcriptase zinc-binding domain-containing protein n=1 Tax=Sesamum alatum TaxID=300844 RepID=A0AAE1YQ19_9LAMI|nr:hypothetical protein Salat_0610200 [Sesamum alatum]